MTQDPKKLGNIGKISKPGGDIAYCPVSHLEIRNGFDQKWSKVMQKQISKDFVFV